MKILVSNRRPMLILGDIFAATVPVSGAVDLQTPKFRILARQDETTPNAVNTGRRCFAEAKRVSISFVATVATHI